MEEWDLLTKDRLPLGRTAFRGEALPSGAFHLATVALIVNGKGELLMTRRSAEKAVWAGYWECTAGSALAGETSRDGMLREIREEIGVTMPEGAGTMIRSFIEDDAIWDAWLFQRDLEIRETRLQVSEVSAIKYVGQDELRAMFAAGEVVPTLGLLFGLLEPATLAIR